MKQIKVILYTAALMLAACATNDTAELSWCETGIGNEGQTLISLSASETLRAAATRAETDIQTGLFDADEILQGYVTLNTETPTDFSPLLTTREAMNGVNLLVANQQLYWPVDPTKTISVYALYPQTVTSATTDFTVSDDQRTDEAYKASDLMWGGDHTNHTALTTSYDAENATLNIPFLHKMAKLVVNAATDGSVSGVVINGITVKNVDRTIAFTPTTGVLGALSGTLGTIQMSNNGACLLPPQTIAADAAFIDVSVTIGGNDYTATYKAGAALEMLEGYQYTLNIIVGSQSLGLISTINDWSSVSNTHIITPKEFGSISMAVVTDDFIYDGTEKTPEPVVTAAGVGTLTKGTDFDYTYYANTNAGTNTALVVATGKSGTDYVGQVAVQKFTINKATPVITPPTTATGLTYNGSSTSTATAQQLLSAAGSATFGTLLYSVDEIGWYANYDDASISKTNANKDPGHKVYLKVVETDNWNEATGTVYVPIAKRPIIDWSIRKDGAAMTSESLLTVKTGTGTEHTKDLTISLGDVDSDDYGMVTIKNGDNALTSETTPVGASVNGTTITVYGNASTTSSQPLTVTIGEGNNYEYAGYKNFMTEVKTDDPGIALDKLTGTELGYIVSSNGKAYDVSYKDSWEDSWGTKAGVVVCFRTISTGNLGYVVSLKDCSGTYNWDNRNNGLGSLTAVSGYSWIVGQIWQYTYALCGGQQNSNATAWNNAMQYITEAGGESLGNSRHAYWTSDDCGDGGGSTKFYAWDMSYSYGGMVGENSLSAMQLKQNAKKIRPIFTFNYNP